MNNKKSTKRALLMSVLSLLVCMTMLIGSTFAWFTDSATSAGNRIVAGNLDVDLLMHDGSAYKSIAGGTGDIFNEATVAQNSNVTLWEPGKTQIVYLAVKNAGTLDLKYNIILNIIDGGLVGALEYAVVDGAQAGDLDAVENWEALKAVAQTGDIVAGRMLAAPNGAIKANAAKDNRDYFALAVHMKEDAGNEYQGDNIVIDVAVEASQLASESDSFGSDYDKLATFANGAFLLKAVEETVLVDNGNFVYENEEGTIKVSGESGESQVNVTVTPTNTDKDVVIAEGATGKSFASYDVEVEGYAEGSVVNVEIFVGKGLSDVKVYHEDQAMLPSEYDYDSLTGVVTIKATSFSVYTIAFNTAGVLPLANVTVLTEMPTVTVEGKNHTLDAAYLFEVTETYEEALVSPYRYWHADFVVSVDKPVKQGTAGLAGSYASWKEGKWEAFYVPEDIAANDEIRLLWDTEKITVNYEELCDYVRALQCGVFDIDGANSGTTLRVELRLYETEAPSEENLNSKNIETGNYKVIGVYNYTF